MRFGAMNLTKFDESENGVGVSVRLGLPQDSRIGWLDGYEWTIN